MEPTYTRATAICAGGFNLLFPVGMANDIALHNDLRHKGAQQQFPPIIVAQTQVPRSFPRRGTLFCQVQSFQHHLTLSRATLGMSQRAMPRSFS